MIIFWIQLGTFWMYPNNHTAQSSPNVFFIRAFSPSKKQYARITRMQDEISTKYVTKLLSHIFNKSGVSAFSKVILRPFYIFLREKMRSPDDTRL